MSEAELPGDVIEQRELWSVSFRKKGEEGWHKQGTETADLSAALRIYDYWAEDETMENRLIRTTVVETVEDVESAREKVENASALAEGGVVHSE